MVKQGVRPTELVEQFIRSTFEETPKLNDREVAQLAWTKFGDAQAVDQSTVRRRRQKWVDDKQGGTPISAEKGAVADKQPQPGGRPTGLEVNVTSDMEGWDIVPHLTASVTIPIRIYFDVSNKTDQMIQYAQLHAWVPSNLYWYPDADGPTPWAQHDYEDLPKELQTYDSIERRSVKRIRWTARFTPNDHFALIPSDQQYRLPPLELVGRPWGGFYTIPWKIEAPSLKPTVGGLLLCNGATFSTRVTGRILDRDQLAALDDTLVAEYLTTREQERERFAAPHEFSD